MDENEFEEHCGAMLQQIANTIEESDEKDELDIDYVDGVLTIDFPDERQMVINRHRPTQKIWLSSPESGASYYEYDEESETWINGEGNDLLTLLADDIEEASDLAVDFD